MSRIGHIARALLTPPFHQELKHLSLDLGKPVQELLADAAVLLSRYHDRGHGLSEPEPPKPSSGRWIVRAATAGSAEDALSDR